MSELRPPYRYEVSDHGPATIYDSVDVGWVARVKESLPGKEALAATIVAALNDAAEADEARRWLEENFLTEDDETDVPLVELVQRVYEWGNQAWYMAGKADEQRGVAFDHAVELAKALRDLRGVVLAERLGIGGSVHEEVRAEALAAAERLLGLEKSEV